jgi:diguanylate cyclase (GGDEF)-like protein
MGDQAIAGGSPPPGAQAATSTLLAATRELLWIEDAGGARRAAEGLVRALGGTLVPAGTADAGSLPIDVSFAEGAPVLPAASTPAVRALLARHLPGFVRDAHRALELVERTRRLAEDASIDPLTGLANRRAMGRALGRLRPDDVVVLLDLDHFKRLNDRLGHAQGDGVLRAFGHVLADVARARDIAGRYGGEEFLVILDRVDAADAEKYLLRLRARWEQLRPHPVTFSAGLARVSDHGDAALREADAAMYAAKAAGRDRWMWPDGTEPATPPPVAPPYVAFSEIAVPEQGADALVAAFEDRLGAVDGWPGFRHLEVWSDAVDPTHYVMVSWWDTEDSFRAYMRSGEHRRSHARIPTGELRPRPDTFRAYRIVAR